MKKEFVSVVLKNNRYICDKFSSEEMANLAFFLTDDVGCYNPWYKEWALDENHLITGGNFSDLEKDENYILVGCELDDDSVYLKIHKNEFIKILDAWEQFCKTRPKEIIIIKENDDTFTIEVGD